MGIQHLFPNPWFVGVFRPVMRNLVCCCPANRAFRVAHHGRPTASIEIGTEEQGEIFGINPERNGGFVGRKASNATFVMATAGDRLFDSP